MPVAVDRGSLRWTKQKPSKLLPIALYAAFSAAKFGSVLMSFLPCANVFAASLQTFTHPQFKVGSECFALYAGEDLVPYP